MGLKTKTFVFVLVSFLLGCVAGGFVWKMYLGPQGPQHRPTRATMQKQFAERLHLNAVQSAKVDSILEAFRQNFSQVQKGYWQSFHTQRDTLRMSIRALLDPDQNKLYDNYVKETDSRESHRRENPDR
jgi:hypothetical protein